MRQVFDSLFLLALPTSLALFVAGLIAPSRRLLALAAGIAAGLAFLISLLVGQEETRKPPAQPTP
jgi:hypothetical protein